MANREFSMQYRGVVRRLRIGRNGTRVGGAIGVWQVCCRCGDELGDSGGVFGNFVIGLFGTSSPACPRRC